MILSTAAFLSALGTAMWLIGQLNNYQGIATIGAILMVGVGAAAMVDGIQTESGEIETELSDGSVEIETQYTDIGTTTSFPLGMLLTLLGGTMTARAIVPDEFG